MFQLGQMVPCGSKTRQFSSRNVHLVRRRFSRQTTFHTLQQPARLFSSSAERSGTRYKWRSSLLASSVAIAAIAYAAGYVTLACLECWRYSYETRLAKLPPSEVTVSLQGHLKRLLNLRSVDKAMEADAARYSEFAPFAMTQDQLNAFLPEAGRKGDAGNHLMLQLMVAKPPAGMYLRGFTQTHTFVPFFTLIQYGFGCEGNMLRHISPGLIAANIHEAARVMAGQWFPDDASYRLTDFWFECEAEKLNRDAYAFVAFPAFGQLDTPREQLATWLKPGTKVRERAFGSDEPMPAWLDVKDPKEAADIIMVVVQPLSGVTPDGRFDYRQGPVAVGFARFDVSGPNLPEPFKAVRLAQLSPSEQPHLDTTRPAAG